jgi:predicted PurR-regulated permease PerM
MFSQNVGSVDRIVRIILGPALILVGFLALSGTLGIVVGIIGFIPLLTGLTGWCPLYLLFHIQTNKRASRA